jgi:hypothetical protein
MVKHAITNLGNMLLIHFPDQGWKLSQRRLVDPASVRLALVRATAAAVRLWVLRREMPNAVISITATAPVA